MNVMEKKIAIVTGASGGIGKEFVRLLCKEDIDEIWAVARSDEKLKNLQKEQGKQVKIIPMDLTESKALMSLRDMLEVEKPLIRYLVNNAGIAKMGTYRDFTLEEIEKTVMLNCCTLASLSTISIPYMRKGSRLINLSSASSFQPLPYLNLYASTKVFERYYSRALNMELKHLGITSTAVCPSWVDTELLSKEVNGKNVRYKGIVTAEKVAAKAIKDAKRGKDMSVCTVYIKYMHILAKILPQKMSMNAWVRGIKKYQ